MKKLLLCLMLVMFSFTAYPDNYTLDTERITYVADQQTLNLISLPITHIPEYLPFKIMTSSQQVKETQGNLYGVIIRYKDVDGPQVQFLDSSTNYGDAKLTIIIKDTEGTAIIPLGNGDSYANGISCVISSATGNIEVVAIYK